MNCSKCGVDLPEDAKYYLECGNKRQDIKNKGTLLSNILSNNKKAYIIRSISAWILITIVTVMNFNDSIGKFERLLLNRKYQEAKNVYSQRIEGDEAKESDIKLYGC